MSSVVVVICAFLRFDSDFFCFPYVRPIVFSKYESLVNDTARDIRDHHLEDIMGFLSRENFNSCRQYLQKFKYTNSHKQKNVDMFSNIQVHFVSFC